MRSLPAPGTGAVHLPPWPALAHSLAFDEAEDGQGRADDLDEGGDAPVVLDEDGCDPPLAVPPTVRSVA
ncbi:hypothetical protein AQI84_37545 [Streptomyces griseorubiginosus]|nr:hypothetical protein AQI84_37545 [Streptomyces griseorubiginosus]